MHIPTNPLPFEVRFVRSNSETIETTAFATLAEAKAFMLVETNSQVLQNGYEIPGERFMPCPPTMKMPKEAAHHDLRADLLDSQTPPRAEEAKVERDIAKRIRERVSA